MIPQVSFGNEDASKFDWRKAESKNVTSDADDDEQLAETPADVVAMLGFDPLKEA